jgi:hypothetical protein
MATGLRGYCSVPACLGDVALRHGRVDGAEARASASPAFGDESAHEVGSRYELVDGPHSLA